jgi:4-hydroxy-4-methyl-2-oxoglutarate aldolase
MSGHTDRPDDTIAPALLELGSATLGESGARAMRARISAAWPGATIIGRALPVRCTPGDNLAIHVANATAHAGDVLVVDVGDEPELGYWGEVLTTGAQARGIVGLVIDGGVRDVAALEAHRFGVFSALVALRGATKNRPGTVGADVTVGDVLVQRGDWIVGDRDGVAVVPRDAVDDVLAAGRARAEKEDGFFAKLREGTTTIDLLSLDTTPIAVTD